MANPAVATVRISSRIFPPTATVFSPDRDRIDSRLLMLCPPCTSFVRAYPVRSPRPWLRCPLLLVCRSNPEKCHIRIYQFMYQFASMRGIACIAGARTECFPHPRPCQRYQGENGVYSCPLVMEGRWMSLYQGEIFPRLRPCWSRSDVVERPCLTSSDSPLVHPVGGKFP